LSSWIIAACWKYLEPANEPADPTPALTLSGLKMNDAMARFLGTPALPLDDPDDPFASFPAPKCAHRA